MKSRDSLDRLSLKEAEGGCLVMFLSGDWDMESGRPALKPVEDFLHAAAGVNRLAFDTSSLRSWNSLLITFLLDCQALCKRFNLEMDRQSLPEGVRQLMALAEAVPEKPIDSGKEEGGLIFLLGKSTLGLLAGGREMLDFLGESCLAVWRGFRGKARFRRSEALLILQQCGAESLPIVALINFLVGLILAFVGAVQLAPFGASIYVADLVAIAMTREMGCLMTGIIICGRIGASFAAQIGAMQVNEEVDSLKTFGFDPVEFLVLPRLAALFLMMPLLCLFADLMGIVGGILVSLNMLEVGMTEFLYETMKAVTLTNFYLGVVKGSVFGALVAVSGCLRGLQCGKSSAAVGQATTSAVVTGITSIIIADAIFAVLCNVLEI